MTIDLFIKDCDEPFATVAISKESLDKYHNGDAAAFLKKTAKNYAYLRKELIIAKSPGLEDITLKA
jgi:hypothetical protein